MKVSIITAIYNNRATIEQCIKSVRSQSYSNIEHIIIDGCSTDGSLDIIKSYGNRAATLISEPDNGIYYALNKGLELASGDIVGFLHADDTYAHNKAVETVVSQMTGQNVDSCYGDLLYVSRENAGKVVRYWKSSAFKDGLFKKGWMPPHPTFFVKKAIYDKYGNFNTDFKIAADYELMLRFLEINNVTTHYIPSVLIRMKLGGTSNKNLKNIVRKTSEDYRARKVNNLQGCAVTILLKNVSKIEQFLYRQ